MKKVLLGVLLLGAAHVVSFGQSRDETEIRRLEQLELDAMQKGDTVTVLKLWSKDYVVNNPANRVVTVPQILDFIRTGQIDYSTVERRVEKVTLTENIAISMEQEVVTPQNATDNAG